MIDLPELVAELFGITRRNVLTSMSKLNGGRMLLIIDFDKVISEVIISSQETVVATDITTDHKGKAVFYVDDSKLAHTQIDQILDGIRSHAANNGDEAWEKLLALAQDVNNSGQPLRNTLHANITDVEMHNLDGYVLSGKIKSDPRFDGVPVLMHSSLSASENERLGMKAGVDSYVPKLRPKEFYHASVLLGPQLAAR